MSIHRHNPLSLRRRWWFQHRPPLIKVWCNCWLLVRITRDRTISWQTRCPQWQRMCLAGVKATNRYPRPIMQRRIQAEALAKDWQILSLEASSGTTSKPCKVAHMSSLPIRTITSITRREVTNQWPRVSRKEDRIRKDRARRQHLFQMCNSLK